MINGDEAVLCFRFFPGRFMGPVGVARVKYGLSFSETARSLNHTEYTFRGPRQPRAEKGQASADLHLAPAGDLALDPGSRTQRQTLDVIYTRPRSFHHLRNVGPQSEFVREHGGSVDFPCPLGTVQWDD